MGKNGNIETMPCGTDAAVSTALAGVLRNKTPMLKISMDGGTDAAVSIAFGGVLLRKTPRLKISMDADFKPGYFQFNTIYGKISVFRGFYGVEGKPYTGKRPEFSR